MQPELGFKRCYLGTFSCLTSKNDNVSQTKSTAFLVFSNLKERENPVYLSRAVHPLMGYPFRDPLECYSVCFDLILRK